MTTHTARIAESTLHDTRLFAAGNSRRLRIGIIGPGIGTSDIRLRIAPMQRIGHPMCHAQFPVITNRKVAPVSANIIFSGNQSRVVSLINIVGVLAVSGQFAPCPVVLRGCGIGHLPQPQGHGITAGIGDGYFRRAVLFGAVFLQVERQRLSHRTARRCRKP